MPRLSGDEQAVDSNLGEELREEALALFRQAVKQGHSIKVSYYCKTMIVMKLGECLTVLQDCIARVQEEVLPRVPNERNKFFIKFTFDNQLQVRSECERTS